MVYVYPPTWNSFCLIGQHTWKHSLQVTGHQAIKCTNLGEVRRRKVSPMIATVLRASRPTHKEEERTQANNKDPQNVGDDVEVPDRSRKEFVLERRELHLFNGWRLSLCSLWLFFQRHLTKHSPLFTVLIFTLACRQICSLRYLQLLIFTLRTLLC